LRLLFVCRANQCRSPMAEALAKRRFAEAGCPAEIRSAGFLAGGVPSPRAVCECVREVGLDLDDHRSRTISPELLATADLILVMTRQQLIEVAAMAPNVWTRCFTLREAVARGQGMGQRPADQPIESWVRRLAGGRKPSQVINLPRTEDIVDPLGGGRHDFTRTRDELDSLIRELARLLCTRLDEPVENA
jgi:protein-tyrosine phosphatase